MSFKPTPLLVLSIVLPSYGIYLLFSTPAEYEFLDQRLLGIILIAVGFFCFIIVRIFREIFKKNLRRQFVVEGVLLGIIIFSLYKLDEKYQFTLPQNYQGYVIIVYGVDNSPPLKRPWYSDKTSVVIPSSGIVLTSSKPDRRTNESAIFIDNGLGNIENLPEQSQRFGFHYKSKKLICAGAEHKVEIWVVTSESIWSDQKDSIYQLGKRFDDLCKQLVN